MKKVSVAPLSQELRLPPKPDGPHLIASEKIYFSDPDFKTFYRILCRAGCVVDFHGSCWKDKKSAFKEGLKIPSEKDFLG